MPRTTDPTDADVVEYTAPLPPGADPRQTSLTVPTSGGLIDRLGWRRFGRNVWILLLFTLGKGFQISIGAVTINLYVYSLGYKQDFVGLFAGMSALAALLMAVPAGMISDRLGRKPVLLITGLITPLTLVAIAFSASVPAVLISSFANGIFASFYWVTAVPMLAESVGDDERVGALAMNSFLLLGIGALGSLVGGFVPEIVATWIHQPATHPEPLRAGILAAAVIVTLAALPLFWLRVPKRAASPETQAAEQTAQPSDERAQAEAPSGAGRRAQSEPSTVGHQPQAAPRRSMLVLFAMLLIPDLFLSFGEGMVIGLLQLFFFLKFGLQPGTLGGLFTVAGILG